MTDDLSRYTVGPSGKAPAMEEQEHSEVKKKKEVEEKEVKKGYSGFGIDPRKRLRKKVPLEVINKRLYVVGLALLIIVLLSTGSIFYFRTTLKLAKEEETPIVETQSEAEIPISTPEPLAVLKRSEITLDVLNGSGTAGKAGSVADEFSALGYQIFEIGNTEATEGNQLYINPKIEGDFKNLLSDVEDVLKIASSSGDLLDSTASARVILGR